MVFTCFGSAITWAFPYVREPYLAEYHKYTGSLLMIICYMVYLKACYTEPGKVTKDNHTDCMKRFEFDNVIFKADC